MFRDLKEYQEIQELYSEKVSKLKELDENRNTRGSELAAKRLADKPKTREEVGLKPKPPIGGGGRISPSSQNMRGKIKPMPTTAEIRAKNPNVVPGTRVNEVGAKGGGKPSEGDFKKDFPDKKPKPLTKREKFDKKFIKKDKGVGFVRRGSPNAVRAEFKEKQKLKMKDAAAKRKAEGKTIQQVKDENKASMKAKAAERFAAFKAKRAAKKEARMNKEEFSPYDIVLEYLLSSEQAATIEEANYVMTEMDAETIQGIVEEQKKNFDEGLASMALKTGAAIGGALLAKKGLGDMKKKFDNYLNKQRDKGIGGNTRPGSDKMYYGK